LTGSALVAQVILNGLMAASIYILVALGLTLVLSIMGIVQLAHGEIYMLGAYGTYYFCVSLGLHYLLALIISTLLVGVAGIIIEKIFFRPFRQGDFMPSIIMAVGLMIMLQTTATVSFGSSIKVVTTPFPGVIRFAGAIISWERLIVIVISVIFVAGLFLLLQKTKIGQAMVAVSQDLQGAALQGISADRVSSFAMFFGSGLAAVAGGLMGAIFNLSPSMGGLALMKGIAVIILGGLGSLPGVVVGGLILGFIDSVIPPFLSVQLASLVGFIIIILILVFRPEGIMGRPSP
jgi:branched-chain amino acid transport system permease protein